MYDIIQDCDIHVVVLAFVCFWGSLWFCSSFCYRGTLGVNDTFYPLHNEWHCYMLVLPLSHLTGNILLFKSTEIWHCVISIHVYLSSLPLSVPLSLSLSLTYIQLSFDDIAKYGGVYGEKHSALSTLQSQLQSSQSTLWTGMQGHPATLLTSSLTFNYDLDPEDVLGTIQNFNS